MLPPVEVVVSGIGGLFPKANNMDEFTKNLLENICRRGQTKCTKDENNDSASGKDDLENSRYGRFDASFFRIHRSQANYLDPLTRVFLEKTFEAIIDAGLNPMVLRGKHVPVIIGSTVSETESELMIEDRNKFVVTGLSRCMMASRVSYWLNTNGPSLIMDANWNSGIQTIQQAMSMIQCGMCDSAIVGASNLCIKKSIQWLMQERFIISEDGLTRSLDEKADGYSRSHGVVVLYLQRADLAKRNYATLLYANSIFNGSHSGDFIGCDHDSFYNFLKKCYEECGVKPEDIAYLETYGCGVKAMDETELSVVEQIFCANRSTPLQIGSVKTNIGHAEPVSALMSLIKIIVAMETGIIPAHLNYDQPNVNIPALINGKIEVVTKNKPWTGEIAAINSIGIGSSYGHLIVRSNKQPKLDIKTDLPLLLTYSTRTEEGIKEINEICSNNSPDLFCNKLIHDVFSSNIPGHLYRGYHVKGFTDMTSFKHYIGKKPPIWFIYSGMGSQWQTMGRDLMKLPIFAEAVYKCHNILKPEGIDLVKIITEDDPEIFDNILNSFVGIAVVQIGLTDVLNAIGIHPDGIIGHSVGELGCAYADKCLTAEQMILSAYYRGKASLESDLIVGMMAAVGMGYSELKNLCPEEIDIACHNSNESCTISGPAEHVMKFVNELHCKDVFAKLVNVSNIAYHSRYIKPAAPLLLSYLKGVISEPKVRSSKWICTSVCKSNWQTDLAKTVSPEYLTNNLLSPVLFEEGLQFIEDYAVAIEIAPHGLLQAILRRALHSDVINMSLAKRKTDCLEFLFNSLGQIYINGVDFNLNTLYPMVPHPVPKGTGSLCSLVLWEHGDKWAVDMCSELVVAIERRFHVNLNSIEFSYLNDYQVDNKVILPPTLYLEIVNEIYNKDGDVTNITFENIVFKNHVTVLTKGIVSMTIMIQPGTELFEITHEGKTIVTGKITKNNNEKLPTTEIQIAKQYSKINQNNFYKQMNINGYNFPNEYKLVTSIQIQENGFKGTVQYTDNWKAFVSAMFQMHIFYKRKPNQNILLPKYIHYINISFDNLENIESTLYFNNYTGIFFSNNGVYISGIKYELLETVSKPIQLGNTKFMKYFNENIEDVEYGLNLCTKILLDNMGTQNLLITELKEKYSQKYLPHVENYLNQKDIDVRTMEINEIDYSVLNESSLTIISGKFLSSASYIMLNTNSFFLLCFPKTNSLSTFKKHTIITQFSVNNSEFYLLKKVNVNPIKVINIKDNQLSYKNMETNSNSWTIELKSMPRDENLRIYLVSRTIPVEGIQEFVTQMQNIGCNGQSLRFMFILDPSAPECKPGERLYTSVFEQDFVVQVLNNGNWGSFVDMCKTSKIVKSKTSSALVRALNSDDFVNACKVKYVGLHVRDLTRIDDDNVPCEVGAVDFAGTNTTGDKIMGLAQTDLDQCMLATDLAFMWPVPENWTLCDAATVPYAYTMAYYTLFSLGNISKGDLVLVHAGCSEIGQAALHVAYNYGCTVFTTVANDRQRAVLQKLLTQIDHANILNFQNAQFEQAILSKTNGRGINVILNCLSGDCLPATKRLLAAFGRFIQLGTADMNEYTTIGMKIFDKNASFYGVTGQNLLRLHQTDKQQLQEMISNDIKRGIVTPIPKRICKENYVDDSLRYLRSSTVMGAVVLQVDEKYMNFTQIQNQQSYLIYADEQDSWLTLVNWLVRTKGSKRIMIANVMTQNQDFINRYLSTIKQTYDTDIILTSHNANTCDNAKKLVNEISLFESPIETFIFAMNDGDHSKLFANIDATFCQNKLNGKMVCILGINKEQSYFRANGLPVCNITWDETYSFQDFIRNFDTVLTSVDNINVHLKGDAVVTQKIKDDPEIAEDEPMLLPNNLKTLKQLARNELSRGSIMQLASFGPCEVREVPPVFVVPGLDGPRGPELRHLTEHLMHPLFCVHLPPNSLDDDIVNHLVKEILHVYQSDVYKLIGLSWGGILAIEIAKHLEILGKTIELHLVDGSPRRIHNFTKNFTKNGMFNMALLKQVIKIDGKNIDNMLRSTDLSKFDYKDVIKSLTVLKNLIEYSNFYKPLQNKIIGPTTLILPETANDEDSLDLEEHCEKIYYKVMPGKHGTILQDKTVIDFLNDNLV